MKKMQLLPKDLFEKLEFDKVLHLLEQECMGEPGRALVRELVPSDRKSQIEVALSEAQEFTRSIEHNDHFPVRAYESVDEELEMLKVSIFKSI